MLALEFFRFARTLARIPLLLVRLRLELRTLARSPRGPTPALELARPPVYLRGDLIFGLTAGGSVGHVAGGPERPRPARPHPSS